MWPSSAALPRRQKCSAARPISSCSTSPIRSGRARERLSAALARIVRARAINPRFIAGQMRHGPRGAAEFAETVDRLVAFAETTDAVASELFDLLHEAYVADADVRAFLLRENPQAAAAIADRLDAARRRGFWHPRRNDVDAGLAALRAEADRMTARVVSLRSAAAPVPDLSAPMPTGDGLLVRLMPVGTIPLDAFGSVVRGGARAWQRHHRRSPRAAAFRFAD